MFKFINLRSSPPSALKEIVDLRMDRILKLEELYILLLFNEKSNSLLQCLFQNNAKNMFSSILFFAAKINPFCALFKYLVSWIVR